MEEYRVFNISDMAETIGEMNFGMHAKVLERLILSILFMEKISW